MSRRLCSPFLCTYWDYLSCEEASLDRAFQFPCTALQISWCPGSCRRRHIYPSTRFEDSKFDNDRLLVRVESLHSYFVPYLSQLVELGRVEIPQFSNRAMRISISGYQNENSVPVLMVAQNAAWPCTVMDSSLFTAYSPASYAGLSTGYRRVTASFPSSCRRKARRFP
ncbi:hypothetical protein CKALI_07000 [Corynebacterium kalinowskii]|uniref:Uncharacterized protein n=1 Tax=Corynebacterium kalinowskii TaxID=2675216 RepID=A0A6B8VAU9_9CORY|nr:hypothetical protein CKALI_07000 [Corynebacterium kalinowskii]